MLKFANLSLKCYDEQIQTITCLNAAATVDVDARDGELHIAIRGSDDIRDILMDSHDEMTSLLLICSQKEASQCLDFRVHAGFHAYYRSLQSELVKAIQAYCDGVESAESVKGKAKSKSKRVEITGHSLGGAAATLCALEASFICEGRSELQCITFASPKVGDAAFARFYDERVPKTCRVANIDDVVPRYPWSASYTHVCKSPVYLHSSSENVCKLSHEPPIYDWITDIYYRIFILIQKAHMIQKKYDVFNNHSMYTYIKQLTIIK